MYIVLLVETDENVVVGGEPASQHRRLHPIVWLWQCDHHILLSWSHLVRVTAQHSWRWGTYLSAEFSVFFTVHLHVLKIENEKV